MRTTDFMKSERDDWRTPDKFFSLLDDEFHFTLDAASSDQNAKCEKHFTLETDGLSQDWGGYVVFCNPPYCKKTETWVEKCYRESKKPDTTVVALLNGYGVDRKWFHDYVIGKAEVRYVRGRLKFDDGPQHAPFGSVVIVWGKGADVGTLKSMNREE